MQDATVASDNVRWWKVSDDDHILDTPGLWGLLEQGQLDSIRESKNGYVAVIERAGIYCGFIAYALQKTRVDIMDLGVMHGSTQEPETFARQMIQKTVMHMLSSAASYDRRLVSIWVPEHFTSLLVALRGMGFIATRMERDSIHLHLRKEWAQRELEWEMDTTSGKLAKLVKSRKKR